MRDEVSIVILSFLSKLINLKLTAHYHSRELNSVIKAARPNITLATILGLGMEEYSVNPSAIPMQRTDIISPKIRLY
jgi:hypothetical protein